MYSREYIYLCVFCENAWHRGTNMNDVNWVTVFTNSILISSISYFHTIIPYHRKAPSFWSSTSVVHVSQIMCTNNANNLSSYFAVTFIRAKAFQSSFQKTRFDRVPSEIVREIKSVLRSPSIASRSIDCKSDDRISIFVSLYAQSEKITWNAKF